MSGSKLLTTLSDFFNEKRKKQKKRKDDLCKLMKKLRKYQKGLEKDLRNERKKKNIQQLEAELTVVKKKRLKAHKLMKSL